MTIDRRTLLVTGGAGVGLVVAWRLWPRRYRPAVPLAPGEAAFGAWLKIAETGRVTVTLPQAEHGQGAWTALAQLVADELGADWRTVGVETAPADPFYANPLALTELTGDPPPRFDTAPVLTGGATSVRQWEVACREAGAAARALLCKAAAQRWDADWQQCGVRSGFVVLGQRRLRFAELAADAAGETVPRPVPVGIGGAGQLAGRPLPRLDAPAKVDGSASFAADIRLPDMVHAAICAGPVGDTRLVGIDRAAAARVPGLIEVVDHARWVAAVATTGWAAERALAALAPRFATAGAPLDDAAITRGLDRALAQPGVRVAQTGDPDALLAGEGLVAARYDCRAALQAPIETPAATAQFRDGRLELWLATTAPQAARAAAARAAGVAEDAVTLHPLMIGGGFGQAFDPRVAEQAAILAARLKRPVGLVWSRAETLRQGLVRPPVAARMRARLTASGAIAAWQAAIAAPSAGTALRRQLAPDLHDLPGGTDGYPTIGAQTPYRMPAQAIDWHDTAVPLPVGHLPGGPHGWTCFASESFVDEIAHGAGQEPMSFRIGMLGGDPRLARCLSTVASLGGWNGGTAGSGQGIACWRLRGSAVAVLAEARWEGGRPVVERLVAAVDCGRVVNPDLVRQRIEGGLIFGLAGALGGATGFARNLATATRLADLRLPRLGDTPDTTVELIPSGDASGGVSDIAAPVVAPAVANALATVAGRRFKTLPLV